MGRSSPHPLKAVLVYQGRRIKELAASYGCTAHFAYQVVNGRVHAPKAFREHAAAFTGVPVAELFNDEGDEVMAS